MRSSRFSVVSFFSSLFLIAAAAAIHAQGGARASRPLPQASKEPAPLSAPQLLKLANRQLAKLGRQSSFRSTSSKYTWSWTRGKNSLGHIVLGPGIGTIDYSKTGILLPASTPQAYATMPLTMHFHMPQLEQAFYAVDVFVEFIQGERPENFFAHSERTNMQSGNMPTNYSMSVDGPSVSHFVFVVNGYGPGAGGEAGRLRINIGADKPWIFHKVEVSKLN